MPRIREHILCFPFLNDSSRIHDGNPIRHLGNHSKVMGDQQDGHVHVPLELFQ